MGTGEELTGIRAQIKEIEERIHNSNQKAEVMDLYIELELLKDELNELEAESYYCGSN